mmetsp:Transcript_19974/g.79659  ORF Transcript_19974/g.79659 Transcript_19974/m.79659 type:complete len:124 (-) Transcript_19974:1095-1466(-)
MANSDKEYLYAASVACLLYSILVGGAAFYAYKSKGSTASLVGGGLAGATCFICAVVTFFVPRELGLWAALTIVTAALTIVGCARYRLSQDEEGRRKFVPMGLMAVVSAIVLLLELIALIVIVA